MGISDKIEAFITELLKNEKSGCLELGRNELAQIFNCVPSQINYVIRTRFNDEHGYIVESKRGGGGYLRIRRIYTDNNSLIFHIINSIDDNLELSTAISITERLYTDGIIDFKTANIIKAAVSDNSLAIPQSHKKQLRANIFKNMLYTLL